MSTSQSVIPLDIGAPATADAPARIVWRQQYDSVRDALEARLAESKNDEPSMTHQSFRDEADINIVLKRFGVGDGSKLPGLDYDNIDASYYGDFSNAVDLRTALETMREAETRFMQLPAELRARFQNDWTRLHDWVSDPANMHEAIALKMLTEPKGYIPPGSTNDKGPVPPTPPVPTPPAPQPTPK